MQTVPKRRKKSSTLQDVKTPKINIICKGKPVSLLTQTLINEELGIVFLCCGAATQRGSWPPHFRGF